MVLVVNNFVFMHKIKSQTAPKLFQNRFPKPTHNYPKNFSASNYSIPSFKQNNSKYRISIRGPTLWKSIPRNSEKIQKRVTVFQNSVRKSFSNFETQHHISKSNCLKS